MIGCHWTEVLFADEVKAIATLAGSGLSDPHLQPGLWEAWVARQLGGEQTRKQAEHDVDVEIWGSPFKVEVKFSNAFGTKLFVKGKDYSRNVFRFASLTGGSGKAAVDCVVLVGLDLDGMVYTWAVPRGEWGRKPALTVCCPGSRLTENTVAIDRWNVPPSELLPGVARVCFKLWDPVNRLAFCRLPRAVTLRRKREELERQRRAEAPQVEIPGVVDGEIFDDKWHASNVWHDVCS